MRRDVVRLVTPGTLTEEALLDARANTLAVGAWAGICISLVDMSTGVFAENSDTGGYGRLARFAQRYAFRF